MDEWRRLHPDAQASAEELAAIQEALNGSPVAWMEKVTDEQYAGAPTSSK